MRSSAPHCSLVIALASEWLRSFPSLSQAVLEVRAPSLDSSTIASCGLLMGLS